MPILEDTDEAVIGLAGLVSKLFPAGFLVKLCIASKCQGMIVLRNQYHNFCTCLSDGIDVCYYDVKLLEQHVSQTRRLRVCSLLEARFTYVVRLSTTSTEHYLVVAAQTYHRSQRDSNRCAPS